ncbi:MAG TPA: HAD hydrolase-like protein, partial [bacterium]|nr:HAD hydrolase-like protein [bacterium]
KSQSISEYDILKDYFLQKNIIINDNRFDDILYKLRVADRNELRINRNLKDILKKIQNQYDLILISSHIKQFVERELKMFGLSDFFKEIIYTHNAETVELLKNQTVISNLEQLNIQ